MPAERRRLLLGLAAFLILTGYLVVQLRWVWLYRHGGLLDIDESGYLSIAVKDYIALRDGGLGAWLRAINSPSQQAPVTTAIVSLLFSVLGPHVSLGFVVPVFALLGTVVATYFFARSLGDADAAVPSAALVAATPLLVNFSRDFQFATPATLVTTLALLALTSSDHLRKWPWVVVFGICLGLMPLTRTMTVAFIPGLLLGAGVAAWSTGAERTNRLRRLLVAVGIASATAMTWLWSNGVLVADYLLNSGYGGRTIEFGHARGFTAGVADRLIRLAHDMGALPSLIVIAGLVAGIAAAMFVLAQGEWRATLGEFVRSPRTPVWIFLAFGIAALASSANEGAAFDAPLIPGILVLTVGALFGAVRRQFTFASLRFFLVLIAGVVFFPQMDLAWGFARSFSIGLPYLGSISLVGIAGIEQLYETGKGLNDKNPGAPLPLAIADSWKTLYAETAVKLSAAGGDQLIAFGFRGVMYNINTVRLAALLTHGHGINATQISPVDVGSSVDAYRRWLTMSDAATACVLLTSEGTEGELAPPVDTPKLEQAAQLSTFSVIDSWSTPGGRVVQMWTRNSCSPTKPD